MHVVIYKADPQLVAVRNKPIESAETHGTVRILKVKGKTRGVLRHLPGLVPDVTDNPSAKVRKLPAASATTQVRELFGACPFACGWCLGGDIWLLGGGHALDGSRTIRECAPVLETP